ncbi:MAG: hypothetical protein C4343_02905 [Chloroflexota bacterium]
MINGGILVFTAPFVAYVAVVVARRRKAGLGVLLAYLALGGWVLAAVGVTLFPLPYQRELIESERASQLLGNNLVPFATIGAAIHEGLHGPQLRVLVANVLMFIPFGFFVALLPTRPPSMLRVLGAALIASCAIELSQWVISAGLGYTYRTTDVDDVILNTMGGALGFVAFRVAGSSVAAVLGRDQGGQARVGRPRPD